MTKIEVWELNLNERLWEEGREKVSCKRDEKKNSGSTSCSRSDKENIPYHQYR